jgi:hypothetical protein
MSEAEAGTTSVDLTDPAVQAAIQGAVSKATSDLSRQFEAKLDDEVKGLKGKNEQLLEKLKKANEAREALSAKAEAAEHGVDHEKVEELAERRAQAKAEMIRRELADEIKQASEAAKKNEERATAAERKAHRARVEALMSRTPGIVPGAFNILADSVEKLVTFQSIEGVEVPILQRNGETIPGTVEELLNLAREGRGPVTDRTFCFQSSGQGSGTTSTNGKGSTSSNWWKMTEAEQTEYVEKHGATGARELIDSSPKPQQTQ